MSTKQLFIKPVQPYRKGLTNLWRQVVNALCPTRDNEDEVKINLREHYLDIKPVACCIAAFQTKSIRRIVYLITISKFGPELTDSVLSLPAMMSSM